MWIGHSHSRKEFDQKLRKMQGLRLSISFACLLVAFAVLEGVNADSATEKAALGIFNGLRKSNGLTSLGRDAKLTSQATKCAEFFSQQKKLGNCPYYDKQKTAYLSYYTSSTADSRKELLAAAVKSWKERGSIKGAYGDWFKKFGVGFGKSSAGHYIVALMS